MTTDRVVCVAHRSGRPEPNDRRVGVVDRHVQVAAVRGGHHVTDAPATVGEQRLGLGHPAAVDREAGEILRGQSTGAAFPSWQGDLFVGNAAPV